MAMDLKENEPVYLYRIRPAEYWQGRTKKSIKIRLRSLSPFLYSLYWPRQNGFYQILLRKFYPFNIEYSDKVAPYQHNSFPRLTKFLWKSPKKI